MKNAKSPLLVSKKKLPGWVILIVVAAIFVILNLFVSVGIIDGFNSGILSLVFIYIAAAVSLNLVTGFMGQLVLGHAGFMLVGAYASAIFVNTVQGNLYISLPISLLLGGVLAGAIGFLIGMPALRLKGDYLAIITLGFGEIIRVIATNLSFTGGAQGYNGYPTFNSRTEPNALFSITLFVAILVIFFSYTFGTSRFGRSVIAIREDEIAAGASGINTTYYKLLTFTASAFFAGIAGGLLAQKTGVISLNSYGFNNSVQILMMVVLGGMGSITGSVLAAAALTILPQLLVSLQDWNMLIYSIILILVMLFRPQGLMGRKEFSLSGCWNYLVALFNKDKPDKPSKTKEKIEKEAQK